MENTLKKIFWWIVIFAWSFPELLHMLFTGGEVSKFAVWLYNNKLKEIL